MYANFLRALIDQIALYECFINVTGRIFVHNFASTLAKVLRIFPVSWDWLLCIKYRLIPIN